MLVGLADGLVASFGWIVDHREGIVTALAVIGAGIAAMGLASMVMNLNPVSAIITAIAVAIAALLIYWDDVVQFFKDIGSAISGWVSGAWASVKGFFGFGESAAQEIANGMRAGKENVQAAIQELMSPEEAQAWGKSLGGAFSTGMRQGMDTSGFTIGGDVTPSAPLGSFGGKPDPFLPPDEGPAVSAWSNFWNNILETARGFKEEMAVVWGETSTIIGDAVGEIFYTTTTTWLRQQEAHKDAMDAIREGTETTLQEEKDARDADLASLDENLAAELISQQNYDAARQKILDDYLAGKDAALEEEKRLLGEEKEAYKEQQKSIWEILKDSVRDVLKALKEELLLKSAAALAEAIALTLGLSPLAIPKYAEAGGYALGAAGLHIAGFEKGAVFDEPTMLPAHMIAEGGPEAYLPLTNSVFGKIGEGIVNALAPQQAVPALAGGGDTYIDMRGMYDGATLNVRSESDIELIAREHYSLFQSRLRSEGVRL